VDGEVYAWTAKAAEVTWKDGPVTYRTWVWSSAVTRREEMMNRNLGDGPAVTATASETIMDVPVDVRFTAAGSPLAIRYDGRVWAAGNDWPRHKRTDTEEERLLGMWLHIQRMKYRRNELAHDKEAQLNMLLPGWRDGRTRGRPPGSPKGMAAKTGWYLLRRQRRQQSSPEKTESRMSMPHKPTATHSARSPAAKNPI